MSQGKWDIDPQGVSSVVGKTVKVAGELQGQVSSFASHLQSAATNAGTIAAPGSGSGGHPGAGSGPATGLVGVALGQFAESVQATLQFMATRAGASLNGAVDATKAYLNGDLTMAADAQHKALGDTTPPAVVLPPPSKAGQPAPATGGAKPRSAS